MPHGESGALIVVVEDEPALASLMERALSRLGYAVRVFGAGGPALAFVTLAPRAAAAAVIDLSLPDGRGELWIERLRAIAPGLAIVAMSGLPGLAPPVDQRTGFLAKPFRVADLAGLLDQLLRPSASAT